MWTLMTDAELVSAVRGGAVEPQEAVASLLTPSHGTAPPRAARGTEANGFASLRPRRCSAQSSAHPTS